MDQVARCPFRSSPFPTLWHVCVIPLSHTSTPANQSLAQFACFAEKNIPLLSALLETCGLPAAKRWMEH